MFGFGPDSIFIIPALLIALTVHEYAHARVALYFGDYTAKAAGRVTLNPIPHLDPIGLIMLWLGGLGYAKPVPINPYNFRNGRTGVILVSLAGVAANFLTALVAAIVLTFLINKQLANYEIISVFRHIFTLNLSLAVFNLIPLPPLDGSQVISSFLKGRSYEMYQKIAPYSIFILLALVFTGVLGYILNPLIHLLAAVITAIVGIIF